MSSTWLITQSISLLWRHFQGDVNIITADIKIEGNIIFIMNLTYICSHKINQLFSIASWIFTTIIDHTYTIWLWCCVDIFKTLIKFFRSDWSRSLLFSSVDQVGIFQYLNVNLLEEEQLITVLGIYIIKPHKF